jgi:formylglycine-generating enzyme required for sulfatase activity
MREVNGQKVVMIAIPPVPSSDDPPLFYIMENKVWNDLYRAFMNDPKSKELRSKYEARPGVENLFAGKWEQGAWAPGKGGKALGVDEGRGMIPVFRVTATEAHCFAEWLGGKLPSQAQWLKAAGRGEDQRPGPFDGDGSGIAVNLGADGPWPVDRGDQDVTKYGCRQTAGNGLEWTRTVQNPSEGNEEIPLKGTNTAPYVYVCGQSYAAKEPLTFERMKALDSWPCNQHEPPEVSFRVVLEP